MNATTSIALITKYSTEGFDKVYKHDALSSVLAKDNRYLKFTGTKTVKVAKVAMGGLSDYYRNNDGDARVPYGPGSESDPTNRAAADAPYYGVGYRSTSASTTWQERTIRMDRAAKITIEKFDDEESGGILVGGLLTEFNRTKVVPEVDAFCFSEIYWNAGKKVNGKLKVSVNGADTDAPLAALNEGLTFLGKSEVPEENQIIFMSYDYINALRNTQELTKFIETTSLKSDVSYQMTSYQGRKIVLVPPARFQTEFAFVDEGYRKTVQGETLHFGPQETRVAAGSKDIDFIVMALDAATHVVKFEKTQILSGNEALIAANIDGFVMYARIYHDLFVLDNKRIAIYAHTGWFTTADGERAYPGKVNTGDGKDIIPNDIAVNVELDKDNVVKGIVAIPGDVYLNVVKAPTASIELGTTKLGLTTVAEGKASIAFSDVTTLRAGDAYAKASGSKLYVVNAKGLFIAEALVNGKAQ